MTRPQASLPCKAPLQVLIAGKRGERDRKLTVVNAARFAIVGQSAQMVLRVDDFGGAPAAPPMSACRWTASAWAP